jgi:coenzyme F420-0:L-glutamate ligase/coenzyme F420-1:gamma-L-glutamate ligase
MTLTLTPLPEIPLIQPGDDLAGILLQTCQQAGLQIADGDIFVLTSKIVSKAEGCLTSFATLTPSARAQELAAESGKDPRLCELLLQESNAILRVRPGTVIVEHRLGFVCANAGIDHSNLNSPDEDGWVLLLPENPDRSAREIRARIEAAAQKRIGVLIIDSHGRAWRIGTVGVCIGLSGLPAVVDERGWPDMFGRPLQITILGAADELAAAASLVMGQAAEGTPVVHARGFPYPLAEGALKDILRPKEQDLFR